MTPDEYFLKAIGIINTYKDIPFNEQDVKEFIQRIEILNTKWKNRITSIQVQAIVESKIIDYKCIYCGKTYKDISNSKRFANCCDDCLPF